MEAVEMLDKYFKYELDGNIHTWYDDKINGHIFRELSEKEGGYSKEKAKEYVVKELEMSIIRFPDYFKKYQ